MSTLEETVYRPPLEARSALLEVALGCSYGKCTFCQYSNNETPLQLVSSEMLSENLDELLHQGEQSNRMFLLGGNVLAFRTRYLLDLFHFVQSYLPGITQFCMYARADDVSHKSDEQLTALRAAGLQTLYIGVESGNLNILRMFHKGETPQEIIAALRRLDKIGIQYGLSSILGLGGTDLWRENALDTAALYNQVKPVSIRVMTLTPMPGTPFASDVEQGAFHQLSPRAVLEEEQLFLEHLQCPATSPCRFAGNHVSNTVPLQGTLPADRTRLLTTLREAICGLSDQSLAKSNLSKW